MTPDGSGIVLWLWSLAWMLGIAAAFAALIAGAWLAERRRRNKP